MSEPCTIILITAGTIPERTQYAITTVKSVRAKIRYDNLWWFIADDGSTREHIEALQREIPSDHLSGIWSQHNSYGKSANEGLRATRERGRLCFFLEDDWELLQPLDLWPYAALLMEDESVGMVRLGYLNEGVKAQAFGHRGQLYWRLNSDCEYIFAGHPSLRHIRFHDHAGDYPERLQPGETELGMAWRYRLSPDPKPSIVWPALQGQNGPFGHIGAVQSYIWNGGIALE